MARTVLRYEAGRAIWSPNEPDCRGRVSSGPIGGTTIVGGYPVQYAVPAVARVPEPPRKRERGRP